MTDIFDESITIAGRTVAVGDPIKVLHTAGNKSSFVGTVRGWWINDDTGEVTTIDVWGDNRKGRERMRSLRLDQVEILSTRMKNSIKRKAAQ